MNVLMLVLYLAMGSVSHHYWIAPSFEEFNKTSPYSAKAKYISGWVIEFMWVAFYPIWMAIMFVMVVYSIVKGLIKGGKR